MRRKQKEQRGKKHEPIAAPFMDLRGEGETTEKKGREAKPRGRERKYNLEGTSK